MFSEILKSSGAGGFQIAVMVFFLMIFIGVVIWIIRLKKPYLRKMENLPLDESNTYSTNGDHKNG
jgi:hypothetical protein